MVVVAAATAVHMSHHLLEDALVVHPHEAMIVVTSVLPHIGEYSILFKLS